MKQIPLTQGKVALVDDEDYERVSKYKWCASGREYLFYAISRINGRTELMHRFLTGYKLTDHRNGNGLDNRRENLRPATPAENSHNRKKHMFAVSPYKGLYWRAERDKWRVRIMYKGKRIHVGLFADEVEAAKAYDQAAKELFGAFASLNFPEQ